MSQATVTAHDEEEKLKKLKITGIQRVGVQRIINSLKQEKAKALHHARVYRNVAEKLKSRHRKEMANMSNKVEIVRDFWRNQLAEGCSRSGLMVKLAISGKH